MPDDRYTAADGNNQAIDDQAPPLGITGEDDHQPCDLQMPVGHDGKKLPCHKHIRSMMGEKGPEGVQGSEPHMAEMEQDGKQGLKPMMGDCPCPCPCNKEIPEHIKSMMGERRPEGMQGEQPNMAEMGPDGKKGPEPGEPAMGDNTCGKEGPKPVMSMMGDKNCGPDGHKHIK
ncbi:MAG TPA: hypothetical protein VN455_12290, partial [Methanotrichaceae archaeon]|nr:hypothetical protein [Methanotrichaceae archaeon]